MHRTKKHLQIKKTLPGESGSALSMPLPEPGACHSDPGGAYYMTYQEQIKSPQWQKKRLEILESRGWTCEFCDNIHDKQLHIHHITYEKGKKAWEYDDSNYLCLCSDCHEYWHTSVNDILKQIAYLKTNFKPGLSWEKIWLFLSYYEFNQDSRYFKNFFKRAREFKYPWS